MSGRRNHLPPSLRANGSRERAPDDRLREAIHLSPRGWMDCFVAALLAMTGKQTDSNFKQREGRRDRSRGVIFPGFAISLALSLKRAQGKPGAGCTRSPVCEKCARKAHGLNHRYSRDIPAFPAQWCYGLYALSPGKRPFLPPFAGGKTCRLRSARVAAPGPHDFAVRGAPSSGGGP
jgi:hypothetical protein